MCNNERLNKALPESRETVKELREKLKSESQVKRQNRLQAIYLIATKQAKSRGEVAKMLGFNRNTIAAWFRLYEEKGLEKLLERYQPSGAKPKISEAAKTEINELLASEKGFRSYREIHQLVVEKHQIKVGYRAVHQLVRYKLSAKPKVPRPSNPKKTK